MTTAPFDDGWTFRRTDGGDVRAITLPHDAMIGEARSPEADTSHHGGFFPGGSYVYAKTWTPRVPAAGARTRLVFEAVYGSTVVRLNGIEVGRNHSGYREFAVELDQALRPGTENHLEVHVDNTQTPNGRWYTGSGIYRRVWLEEQPATRFADDGIRIHSRTHGGETTVEVELSVTGDASVSARVRLLDCEALVTEATSPVTSGAATLSLTVPQARLWSHEDPHLYTASVELTEDGAVLDGRSVRVGLRTISMTAARGLQVNGRSVLLQGGAVHHDSGLLGAATFRAAEFRRARILKQNGFNAIRSAHQPASRDLLDAADEVGLYVIDELTDVWHDPKTAHDDSVRFDESWRDDARAMVAKARNHASVIMYSVGNEIGETATPQGVETTRELSTFVRRLDPHRPTTLAMSFLVNIMSSRGTNLFDANAAVTAGGGTEKRSAASSTAANIAMNKIGGIMQLVSRLPLADRVSRDALAEVDVAGYNYAWARYDRDRAKHPNRVIYGSETLPGDIAKAWARVETMPQVIGDFLWTGWDYLGETGLGTWSYGDEDVLLSKSYPHVVAGCGVIDVLGVPGSPSLLARAVWDDLRAPGIGVRPLDRAGQRTHRVAWRGTDAITSWAWSGAEGTRAEIEVYSADDHVELFLNGRSLGRKRCGRARGFLARFRVPYESGTLEAVGYRGGREVSRSQLRSAGEAALRLVPESTVLLADGQDLAYVGLHLADQHGTVEMLADDDLTVTVSGAGELAGLGSACPTATEPYTSSSVRTHYGRALAVVRATRSTGDVTITATSRTRGTATTTLTAVTPATTSGAPA